MKKLFIVLGLTCALAVAANAAEGETKKAAEAKKSPAAELKAARKELIEKYDTNKNKRLDKAERSKMTAEDQAKWESTAPKKKGAEEKK